MQDTTTISVRIPKRLRAEIRKLGISPSKLVRKAFETEIKEHALKEVTVELEKHKKALARISLANILKDVREDRAR